MTSHQKKNLFTEPGSTGRQGFLGESCTLQAEEGEQCNMKGITANGQQFTEEPLPLDSCMCVACSMCLKLATLHCGPLSVDHGHSLTFDVLRPFCSVQLAAFFSPIKSPKSWFYFGTLYGYGIAGNRHQTTGTPFFK